VKTSVVVPTWNGAGRIGALLDSLDGQADEVVVVDNGSRDGTADRIRDEHPWAHVLSLPENAGFSRAVNLAAREVSGHALVLVNDDCVCERGFVAALAARLDATDGTTMAAGVLVEAGAPSVVDSAGMELDATLLVWDYLNGTPVGALAPDTAPPIGPSGAAAGFVRDAFLAVGGFDERLFAYWEDVDLVLRLRREGARCALAWDARARHAHSQTLGSGSAAKNRLTGFGRVYVLRKWSVATPRRLPRVVGRELAICAGQLVVDRTAAGIAGRFAALHAPVEVQPYPEDVLANSRRSLSGTLRRRMARRARLRVAREATHDR
jgi:N-acetylglucosaminyl-diphospho-decaprenol L-rhamnosyltransferase